MANTSSINSVLGGSTVNYDSLMSKASGVHNRGEIVFKKGFFGGFSRINYHVGFWSGFNTVVTTAEQNRLTRAAVFKAILDKYDARGNHGAILNQDFDSEDGQGAISDYLDGEGKNPYLKEAFKFLLCGKGGDNKNPLSRDEMKMLDTLLQKGAAAEGGNQANAVSEKTVKDDVETLHGLGRIKRYGVDYDLVQNADIVAQNNALEWVQGLKIAKIPEIEKNFMLDPTVNMVHVKDLGLRCGGGEDSKAKALAPVLNKITNNVCKVSKPPEPYRNRSGAIVIPNVTEFQIKRMVDKLTDGVSEAIIYSAGRVADYNDNNQDSKLDSLAIREFVVQSIVEKLMGLCPLWVADLGSEDAQRTLDKILNDIRVSHHNRFNTGVKDKRAFGLRTLEEDVLIALKSFATSGRFDLGYTRVIDDEPEKVSEE